MTGERMLDPNVVVHEDADAGHSAFPPTRDIRRPLSLEMLRPLGPEVGVVQFRTVMADQDYRVIGEWIRDYPKVMLRAHATYDRSIMDLEFLRYFPTVTRFSIDAAWFLLGSLDGLGYLSEDTDTLHIGRSTRRLSLEPLRRFSRLRRLYLEGDTRDFDVVSGLTTLESLTLRSITVPDLRSLSSLSSLRALELRLGATRDLRGIGGIGDIRYLELSKIYGFHNLAPVEELANLESLSLHSLPHVTRFPDLGSLAKLRRVSLDDMPRLTDDEVRGLSSRVEVGSHWERPVVPPDLVPNGIREHAA